MIIFSYILEFSVCSNSDYFGTDRRIYFDTDVFLTIPLAKTRQRTNTHTHTHTHTHKVLTIPRIRDGKASHRNPDVISKVPFRGLYGKVMEMLHC